MINDNSASASLSYLQTRKIYKDCVGGYILQRVYFKLSIRFERHFEVYFEEAKHVTISPELLIQNNKKYL